jgi:hypothetical protein
MEIAQRQLGYFEKVHLGYAIKIRKALAALN